MLWDIIQFGGVFVLLIAMSWFAQEIRERLPNKTTKAMSVPFEAKRLSVHVPIESYWFNEFKVQFVNEWEIGHEFSLTGNGGVTFESTNGDDEGKGRLYLQFFPSENPYTGTDQIGWCEIREDEKHSQYVNARILLEGDVIARILEEVRRSTDQTVSIWGHEKENGQVAITSFSLTPNDQT